MILVLEFAKPTAENRKIPFLPCNIEILLIHEMFVEMVKKIMENRRFLSKMEIAFFFTISV